MESFELIYGNYWGSSGGGSSSMQRVTLLRNFIGAVCGCCSVEAPKNSLDWTQIAKLVADFSAFTPHFCNNFGRG